MDNSNVVDVSFIVGVYRANPIHLRKMLDSVLAVMKKSSVKSELLLTDDSSPDNSWAILSEYAAANPGLIRIYKHAVNAGISATRIEMTNLTSGRYVASFDQDDIMVPFDLDGAVAFLDSHPEYAASYARKYLFHDFRLTGEVHGDFQSRFNAFFTPKVNINAMLIRREKLLAHGSFMPCPGSRINDDVFLMFRLAMDCDLWFDDTMPRALYRVHDNQNSKLFDGTNQDDFRRMGMQLINLRPELYEPFTRGIVPESDEENFRIVEGFNGLAVFLLQNDHDLTKRLLEAALERHPEDYGVWEHNILFHAMCSKNAEFENSYERALEHFADRPRMQLAFHAVKFRKLVQDNNADEIEKFRRFYIDLHWSLLPAPQEMLDVLPKPPKRPTYSFTSSQFNF
ncbi:MAG: glycosyltransferase [Victivallaceae bacterium]|nr:glycosyltransferase [Victivallaceae bacterium]